MTDNSNPKNMKQKIKQTLMTIVGLLLSTTAFALDFEVEEIYYNITDATAKTVEVTSGAKKYTGNVTIPPSVTYNSTTYSVTSIGNHAFSSCSGLTLVTIPNSVTSIGEIAFNDCYGLTSVTIPNSVTEIGNYAFTYCSGLTSVTIPNSVTSIGSSAFSSCSGLTEVTIGNSVTSIGDKAFFYCSGLTEVIIPNSVTSIGERAFSDCSGLTELTIGNSVTSIGKYAFDGCSGLTSVNISDLSAWCKIDFGDVYANPLNYAEKLKLNGSEIKDLVIPNNITEIKNYAFAGCIGLTSVTIPNSVTSIGERAFYGCDNLKIVVNLSNLTFSKGSSKYGCIAYYANKVINAPNGSIVEDFVFSKIDDVNVLIGYFGNATELTLPTDFNGESYTIGSEAFYGCTSLTSIVVAGGNSVYDSRDNCNAIIETATNTLILGCKNTTIPNSVTSIGKGAFYDCDGLTEVTIPNSVASIGEMAFYDCSGLTEVTIGNSVTSIGNYAFYNCDNLRIVKSLNNTPPQCDNYAFGNSTTALLMVPKGSMMSYMLADGWRNFTKIQEFEVDDAVKPVLTITYPEGGVVKQKVDNGTIIELQIVPSNGWECNSVTFNGVDVTNKLDADGNYTTPSITADSQLSIVFVKDVSSVEQALAYDIKVSVNGNTITILGADEFAEIEIYNTSGINVYNGIEKSITLDANNIYILTVEGHTFKFAM